MNFKPPSLWKCGLIALFVFMIVIPLLKIVLALVKGVVAFWERSVWEFWDTLTRKDRTAFFFTLYIFLENNRASVLYRQKRDNKFLSCRYW